MAICLSLTLPGRAFDRQFFASNSDSASAANLARRSPASAYPESAHFLAKPHIPPNVTFGDLADARPRTRIDFRREQRQIAAGSASRPCQHHQFLGHFNVPFKSYSFSLAARRDASPHHDTAATGRGPPERARVQPASSRSPSRRPLVTQPSSGRARKEYHNPSHGARRIFGHAVRGMA